MFGGNAAHTQVYQSSFNGQPKEFAWSFKTGGAVRSTPLFSDGRVFFGSADKNFYAIDSKSGDLIWKIETGGAVNSSAALDEKGSLFFLSDDNNLYCVNSANW